MLVSGEGEDERMTTDFKARFGLPREALRPTISSRTLVMTQGIKHWLDSAPTEESAKDRTAFIARAVASVASFDWGNVDEHDRAANDSAVVSGDRIIGVFIHDDGTKVYVISDAWIPEFDDRYATTVLLPDEY